MARIAKVDSDDNIQISCEECHVSTTSGTNETLICRHGEYSYMYYPYDSVERVFIKVRRASVQRFHQLKADAEPKYWEVTDE